jgi:hypothetical protein
VLIQHFNLPFELVELLRYHIKYIMDLGDHVPEVTKRYYHQVISLIASAILLLATLCDYDNDTKQLVIHQYQINRYVQDFLQVISKFKDPFYEQMTNKIKSVAEHVFREHEEIQENQKST